MEKVEAQEKNRLLKEALRVVNKLSKLDIDDLGIEIVEKLIKESKRISKSRYWDVI